MIFFSFPLKSSYYIMIAQKVLEYINILTYIDQVSTFFAIFRTSLYENTGTTSDFFRHIQKHAAIRYVIANEI